MFKEIKSRAKNTFFPLIFFFFFHVQQKIVIKVHMPCQGCRSKAMEIAVSFEGHYCYSDFIFFFFMPTKNLILCIGMIRSRKSQ